MQSENLVEVNIEFIAQKFPNCITETIKGYKKDEKVYESFIEGAEAVVEKTVNFDLLKQELSNVIIEGDKERYVMTWPDKKQAILTANAPIAKTLRPVIDDEKVPTGEDSSGKPYLSSGSVGKDGTPNKFDSENLYIEGDNLDVLKLLRETYLNKIKMIYIDPPYNTGNDFVYNDDFATDTEDYLQRSNQVDEQGNRMVTNNNSNGRFHTDWLNMIYSRLKLAKDLLTQDGVIFISIDDNEQANLKKICDEIFGESNFIADLIWESKYTVSNDTKYISNQHEHILFYSKNKEKFNVGKLTRTQEQDNDYKNRDNDPKGAWKATPLHAKSGTEKSKYSMSFDNGIKWICPAGRYPRYSKDTLMQLYKSGELYFNSNGGVDKKTYLEEVKKNGVVPGSILKYSEVGHTHANNEELASLLGKGIFDNPKGIKLIIRLAVLSNLNKGNIVLDFFSGSATTAHAVMQLNAEDGGNRKFIMVQIPELTSEDSEAYKAGYKNICEIGKERIRRAGNLIKIQQTGDKFAKAHDNAIKKANSLTKTSVEAVEDFENSEEFKTLNRNEWKNCVTDIGFRCLKLDSSCMKDVYYTPSEVSQDLLSKLESNIKTDRSPEDLLFQVMLDMGIMLSSKIEGRKLKIENGKCKTISNSEFERLNQSEKKKIKTIFIIGECNKELKQQPNLICCFDQNISESVVTEIAKMQPLYSVFRDSSMATDNVAVNFDQIFQTYSPTTTRKVI